ncbi:uncharacterized protein LOC135198449 [Macrobrachium nipponense]|uniref:uncharacterized protein LOC135198449 n=1 Tax=Macrobrachium nipponense TaxID=159736 RepID=UPI0030C8123C
MFIIKGMLFMFSLSLLTEEVRDNFLVAVTVSGVSAVIFRIYLVCQIGENVRRANDDVIYAIRSAIAYHPVGDGINSENLNERSDTVQPEQGIARETKWMKQDLMPATSTKQNNSLDFDGSKHNDLSTEVLGDENKPGKTENKEIHREGQTLPDGLDKGENSPCACSSGLQFDSLQNLLSRFEAQRMEVQIWGFECLSAATFSNHVGRILTYLVVLLQLNQG